MSVKPYFGGKLARLQGLPGSLDYGWSGSERRDRVSGNACETVPLRSGRRPIESARRHKTLGCVQPVDGSVVVTAVGAVIAVLVPTSALPGAHGTNLPFKGTFTGPGALDTGSGRLQAHLVGEFTHFGRATLAEDIQVVPIGPGAFSWSGNWTMTAANGDRVAGTSTGSGTFTDPTHSRWSVDFVSTTGTGRFADAVLTVPLRRRGDNDVGGGHAHLG
jgi:hypothetical protein